MFNSRAVPGWIMLGFVLSVVIGIIQLFLQPDATAQFIGGNIAPIALFWVVWCVFMTRYTDPVLLANLLDKQQKLEVARSRSLAPDFRHIGKLLGVKKPVDNPELAVQALEVILNELATAREMLSEEAFQALLAERTATLEQIAADTKTKLEEARAAEEALKVSQQQSSELAEQIAEQQRDLVQLGNELDQSRSKLDDAQSQLGTTRASLETAASQLSEANVRLERVSNEAATIENSLQDARRRLSEMEQQIAALTPQRDQLSGLVGELNVQIQSLRGQRGEIETAVAQASGQLANLQAAITQAREDQRAIADEETRLNGLLPSLRTEVDELELALTEMKSEQDSIAPEIARLRSAELSAQRSLRTVEHTLGSKQRELEECLALVSKRDGLKQELELLGAQVAARRESARSTSPSMRNLDSRPKRPAACTSCADLAQQLTAAISERDAAQQAQAESESTRKLEQRVWEILGAEHQQVFSAVLDQAEKELGVGREAEGADKT